MDVDRLLIGFLSMVEFSDVTKPGGEACCDRG
jgi:hypothetical protein